MLACVVTVLYDAHIVILAAQAVPFASDMLPIQSFFEQTGSAVLGGLHFQFLLGCQEHQL